MPPAPQLPTKEQQLLRHARREGSLIMSIWALALVWSITAGYFLGYQRDAASIRLIFGMPDWIFWSVAVPWALCFLFSIWFCFWHMADDDLGQDHAGEDGHA